MTWELFRIVLVAVFGEEYEKRSLPRESTIATAFSKSFYNLGALESRSDTFCYVCMLCMLLRPTVQEEVIVEVVRKQTNNKYVYLLCILIWLTLAPAIKQ